MIATLEKKPQQVEKLLPPPETPLDKTEVIAKKPPKLDGKYDKAYVKYIESLPKTGPLTLLWDEPDRSLSVEAQITFWSRFVIGLAQKQNVQVVVSSHSLVLLYMPTCFKYFKVIDVEEGYLAKSKGLLEEMKVIAAAVEEVHGKLKDEKPKEEPAHADEASAAKVRGSQKRGEVPGKDPRKGKASKARKDLG